MADFCGGAGEGNRTLVVSLEGLGSHRFSAVLTEYAIKETARNAAELRNALIAFTAKLPHKEKAPGPLQGPRAHQTQRNCE